MNDQTGAPSRVLPCGHFDTDRFEWCRGCTGPDEPTADAVAEDEQHLRRMIDYTLATGGRAAFSIFDVPTAAFAGVNDVRVCRTDDGSRVWVSARREFGPYSVTLYSVDLPQGEGS